MIYVIRFTNRGYINEIQREIDSMSLRVKFRAKPIPSERVVEKDWEKKCLSSKGFKSNAGRYLGNTVVGIEFKYKSDYLLAKKTGMGVADLWSFELKDEPNDEIDYIHSPQKRSIAI